MTSTAISRISGSAIKKATVDLCRRAFLRLERLLSRRLLKTLPCGLATSAMVHLPQKRAFVTGRLSERLIRRVVTATAPRPPRGGPRRVSKSASHEAFALAFRPGEGLFHRLALMVTQAHLGQRCLCVDLLGDLGRRRRGGNR